MILIIYYATMENLVKPEELVRIVWVLVAYVIYTDSIYVTTTL